MLELNEFGYGKLNGCREDLIAEAREIKSFLDGADLHETEYIARLARAGNAMLDVAECLYNTIQDDILIKEKR